MTGQTDRSGNARQNLITPDNMERLNDPDTKYLAEIVALLHADGRA